MPEFLVARRGPKPQQPDTYDPERDLIEKQVAYERDDAAYRQSVAARRAAAIRAHDRGLSWTRIGELYGKVGRTRAREIAYPKTDKPRKRMKP